MMKLNPGERQGWWSAKKFDRRIRMRALVQGAVNDQRTRILLDTGATRRIDIQGINEGKVSTTRRACVKITLGWEMVYEFEMSVMAHSAGVDVVLGTDFMTPAGIRLDLFHGAAQLPHEVQIPLIKTKNMIDSEEYGSHVNAGPPERLDIQAHEWREYRLAKRQIGLEEHVLWVRRISLRCFIGVDPAKVKAIVNGPVPKNKKDLPLTNYVRQYSANYAKMARPLPDLLRSVHHGAGTSSRTTL
ncbi:hypothetical protein PInf_002568 [Phytophthora infestans]|nr:hypothetical protein PInf_002568 [Phytophthora infestans]